MEAKATARYIRIAPRKARRVVDLIRGKHVEEARRILDRNPEEAAIREICSQPDRVWAPRGGEPVIAKLDQGVM